MCVVHTPPARTIHTYIAPLFNVAVVGGAIFTSIRRRVVRSADRSEDLAGSPRRQSLVGYCSLLLGSVGSANVRRYNLFSLSL